MAELSTSTWGDPTATKRVLLIHGMMNSSLSWHHVAKGFTSRGYFVTAPDLLGHGRARRGSDYTIAALAEELRPLLAGSGGNDHPYDIVVGHSLGGLVAATLFPLLESPRSVHVVLIDPGFEQSLDVITYLKQMMGEMIRNPKTPEDLLQELPLWSKEDVVIGSMNFHMCDAAAVDAILDQNTPWSFMHKIQTVPENVKLTVLAADPSKIASVKEEELKPYPHVTVKTIWGASHFMATECPQVVVDTILEGVTSSN